MGGAGEPVVVAPAGIAIDAGEAVMRITLDKAPDNPLPGGAAVARCLAQFPCAVNEGRPLRFPVKFSSVHRRTTWPQWGT